MIDWNLFANFAVAISAIATILLSAYVAWGNNRDKSVELLGSIRGLASELGMRHMYLKDEDRPSAAQLKDFQKACEDLANRLAKRVGRAGGIISSDGFKLAESLTAHLYKLSKLPLSEPHTDSEKQNFDAQLKTVLDASTKFIQFMGKDIETHWKLRNVIRKRVGGFLDPPHPALPDPTTPEL